MADYNDIKQSIATNLPDNNKREITAARLRDTLNGFVDKVQETETGIEGKVSTNESNIGNLTGRMDTNEANVTNLTGRVDSLEQTVENLPGGGDTVKVVDNPGFGGAKDAVSARVVNIIGAISGMAAADEVNGGREFACGKATVHPGFLNDNGDIEDVEGYSYFEYELALGYYNKDLYVTIPGYAGKYVYTPPVEGKYLNVAFYRYNDMIKRTRSILEFAEDIWPMEVLSPAGTTKIRGSLINGTFDPDGVYVVESLVPSNRHSILGLDSVVNKCELPKQIVGGLSENGMVNGEAQYLAIIRLLKNDELEWEITQDRGPWLAIKDSNSSGATGDVIYKGGFYEYEGWVYYKADKDCYAFIAGGGTYKITHNDHFNNNLQDKLNALITRIDPEFGEITLDRQGKGVHKRTTTGTKIVCKVPIVAGSTLNYTLHSTGTFTLGPVAYYYNGQPVATENIEHQATFSENVLGIVGGTKSGYVLVTFAYSGEGDIPAETFNATYLEKNAQ